jgi:hypothetical protein
VTHDTSGISSCSQQTNQPETQRFYASPINESPKDLIIMNLSPLVQEPKTIVLVDPTSDDGETSLDLLEPSDRHVTLLVLLSGRHSAALRDYAAAEEIDISTAGLLYLEQVAARIGNADRMVEVVTAPGPSTALEIADLVAYNDTRRVLVPSSLARVDPSGHGQLVQLVDSVVAAPTAILKAS